MSDPLPKKKAIVSWTGGKDCALSLFLAQQSGLEISGLVTFIPAGSNFRAHPLNFIEKQAKADLFSAAWIGKNITKEIFTEFKRAAHANGVDLCGENGEFHSLVINSPSFNRKLILNSFRVISENKFNYLTIEDVSFESFL